MRPVFAVLVCGPCYHLTLTIFESALCRGGRNGSGSEWSISRCQPLFGLLPTSSAAAVAAPPAATAPPRDVNRWLVHLQHRLTSGCQETALPAAPSGTAACSYPKKKRKRIFIYLKGERNVWGAKIHKEAEQTRDGRGSQTERVGGCEDHRGPCGERSFLKAGCEPVILATRDNVTHSRPPPPPSTLPSSGRISLYGLVLLSRWLLFFLDFYVCFVSFRAPSVSSLLHLSVKPWYVCITATAATCAKAYKPGSLWEQVCALNPLHVVAWFF